MPKYKTNNIELYYESLGNGGPLLFLHGLGSSTLDWEKQVHFFAEKYKVYLLDLRGHGKSSHPEHHYSLDLFSQDVTLFISDIIKRPVHLVGLSLGAVVACCVAAMPSSPVKSLTLINCPAKINLSSLKNKTHYYLRLFITYLFGMKAIGTFLAPKLFPKPEQENLRKKFIQRWATNNKKAYIKSMRSMIGWTIFEKTDHIKCPVYVISAEHDYFPIEEKKKYVRQLKNGRLIVVKDTHHALPFEAPEAFNKALLDVLKETQPHCCNCGVKS